MHVAVVGATGQVGGVMLDVLAQRDFPVTSLRLFASSRSAGREMSWSGRSHASGSIASERALSTSITVEDLATADFSGIDIALLSAGKTASLAFAPKIAESGAVVIDNSSAWRMDPKVPLVVADVNDHAIVGISTRCSTGAPSGKARNSSSTDHNPGDEVANASSRIGDSSDETGKPGEVSSNSGCIIANPNCTTMVAMMALKPLHDLAGLQSFSVSTYQACSGAGLAGVAELDEHLKAGVEGAAGLAFDNSAVSLPPAEVFSDNVAFNVLPMCGSLADDTSGETDEEQKFRNESRKILELPDLEVIPTCVRVPVFTGHSMTINAEFSGPVSPEEANAKLANSPGVKVCEQPTPIAATGADETLVGRIRQSGERGLVFFLSGDNLRKGAALNAVQIAELIARRR